MEYRGRQTATSEVLYKLKMHIFKNSKTKKNLKAYNNLRIKKIFTTTNALILLNL